MPAFKKLNLICAGLKCHRSLIDTHCSPEWRTVIRFQIKHLLIGTALIALGLFVLSPLRGMLPPFYYQQYNLVRQKLAEVKELTVTSSWKHEDVILEDCGFDVSVGDTDVYLTFFDGQDWRRLFDDVDGIQFVIDNSDFYISRHQLQKDGIHIDGLTDILEQLETVVEYCIDQADRELAGYSSNARYSQYIKMGIHGESVN